MTDDVQNQATAAARTPIRPIGPADGASGERSGIPWGRYVAAVKRRRVLVAGIVVGALAIGALATRFFRPTYEVHSTIWLATGSNAAPVDGRRGNDRLLAAPAWGEVLHSYSVLDPVVDRLSLFVTPKSPADSAAVASFHASPAIAAGKYSLRVSADGRSWTLEDEHGKTVDRGAVGDSVGRAAGFRWAPRQPALGRDRAIAFTVVEPRQAAMKLRNRLEIGFPDTSFISVRLSGPRPARDARILNEIGRQFVATASGLIRGNQAQSAQQLAQQLGQAESALRSSEEALRNYRTGTVGLPSQDDPSVALRDPSFAALFDQRAELDSVRADRQALERVLGGGGGTGPRIDPAALLAIPSARSAPELSAAIADLTKAQSQLATLRRTYTDEYKAVQDARADIARIEQQTLPTLAQGVLDRLRNRERALDTRVAQSSGALRAVPSRAIDQQRLQRDVQVNASLYNAIRGQYDAARLSELSAVPGVAVLDSAVAPLEPVTNTVPGILLAALLAGAALALATALLLDATDRRLWYPEQVEALGYEIIGAVPRAPEAKREMDDPVAAAQVAESMRSLRLNVLNAMLGARPVALSVLSAEIGDGKSFVATQLARSFAQAGHRTVLVDGDIRRGVADQAFHLTRTPGLTDHLAGKVSLDEATRATTYPNLAVIPSGTRLHEGPELLSSAKLPALITALGARYEIIVVDTPPVGAGADAGCLASATRNALLVLRAGKTDRKAAKTRLAQFQRLPIHLLGVVLNAIRAEGSFASYSYLPEYAVYAPRPYAEGAPVEEERPLAVSRDGAPDAAAEGSSSRPSRRVRPENHW